MKFLIEMPVWLVVLIIVDILLLFGPIIVDIWEMFRE